jgi:predicted dehydrogenase
MGCHTLDFLDYVLGPIRQVCGFAANQGEHYLAEDIVTGSFVFESGVQGVGMWCFTSFDEFDETEILGSQGKIAFSSFDTQPIRLTTDDGLTDYPIDDPPHVHQPLTQTVVDELNGVGTCPSTGESAARTTWVMDQVLEAYSKQTEQD